MKSLRSLCAGLITLSLFFSMLSPLSAQSFPKYLEKDFRGDATLKVERAVKIYNEAKADFEKKGASAFVDKIDLLAPKTFTEIEKTFLAKKVAKELLLPTLLVKGDRLIGLEAGKEIFNLSTFEVAQGVFKFKEQSLHFNSNRRLIDNYESWTKTTKHSFLESLFFPQAHAFSKGAGALVGALLGGVLAWFLWPKISEWFKGKKETPIPDTHSGNMPPVTEAPGAAPPVVSDTPAPAPAADGGSGKEGTPTKAADETVVPKDAGSQKIEPATLKYITENAPKVPTIKDAAELEALKKDEKKYPEYLKAMLEKIKSDLDQKDTAKQLKKEDALKVLSALTLKDGNPITVSEDLQKQIEALKKLLEEKK